HRPKDVPSAGYFKEYKRPVDDWPWWMEQVEASMAYDWSPYLTIASESPTGSSVKSRALLDQLKPTSLLRVYDLLIQTGLKTEVPPEDVANRLIAHRAYLSRWSFIEG